MNLLFYHNFRDVVRFSNLRGLIVIDSLFLFLFSFLNSETLNSRGGGGGAKATLTKSFDNNRSAGMSNVLAGTSFFKYRQNNKTINMQDLGKK